MPPSRSRCCIDRSLHGRGVVDGRCGPRPVGVLLAVGVRLYRDGLEMALRHSDGVYIVGTAANPAGFDVVEPTDRSGIVLLLDVSAGDGPVTLSALTTSSPGLQVVALGLSGVTDEILRCAEAGAAGYVTRDASVAELICTITSVARGELVCPPQVAAALFGRVASLAAERRTYPGTDVLSRREIEIVILIERGLSNKQIAARLFITVATVKNHVHSILEKLGVRGREEAAAWVRSRQRDSGFGQRNGHGGAVSD